MFWFPILFQVFSASYTRKVFAMKYKTCHTKGLHQVNTGKYQENTYRGDKIDLWLNKIDGNGFYEYNFWFFIVVVSNLTLTY